MPGGRLGTVGHQTPCKSWWIIIDGWDHPMLEYGDSPEDAINQKLGKMDDSLTEPPSRVCVYEYGVPVKMHPLHLG